MHIRVHQECRRQPIVHPRVRVIRETIDRNQERQRPEILTHGDERSFGDELGDDGDNEHSDNRADVVGDGEQVRLKRAEAEGSERER